MALKRSERVCFYVVDLGNGYVLDVGAYGTVEWPDDLLKLPYPPARYDSWVGDIQHRRWESSDATPKYTESIDDLLAYDALQGWLKALRIDSTDVLQAMLKAAESDRDQLRSMQSSELDEDQSKLSRPVAI